MRRQITVAEIFGPTIQGEGPLAGLPSLFVRTGGCEFRCEWCDSMPAVDPRHSEEWEEMSADDILDRLLTLSRGYPCLVTLSGGNPALQPLGGLIRAGLENQLTFAAETQGTLAPDWLADLDHLVISPKGPSSGMPFSGSRLAECVRRARSLGRADTAVSLKFVVFDEGDYDFARAVAASHPDLPVYLQAGTPAAEGVGDADARLSYLRAEICDRASWLAARALGDRWFSARVSMQQHVLMWGDKSGV